MGLRDELTEPWGLVVAGLAGGFAWALAAPVGAAVGIGLAVLGAKAVTGAVLGRRPSQRMLPVHRGSPEDRWLARAGRAVRTYHKLASSVREGPIRSRVELIGDRVATTSETLERLAGQASAVSEALRTVDAAKLRTEAARLSADIERTADQHVRSELRRALGSVETQLGVHERLRQASEQLLARLGSGTIGLEGLVARLAEVLALSERASDPDVETAQISTLADELEGLRAGLAETEDLSQRALRAYREQT